MINMRYDCFVIWGHGVPYLANIIEEIESAAKLTICHIEKKRFRNIKSLVRKIYSFDYAPLIHLTDKIAYLKKIDPTVFFIFVENHEPLEDFYGTGDFRHIESNTVRKIKNNIRTKYNPKTSSGEPSHNHVIHATDNQSQTLQMLGLLYRNPDLRYFDKVGNNILPIPKYINEPKRLTIRQLDFEDIYCSNFIGDTDKPKLHKITIEQSVQYQGIEKPDIYQRYIEKYLGTGLRKHYSIKKYQDLQKNMKYLGGQHSNSSVLVTQVINDLNKFIILDGLHRAAILRSQGKSKIMVCIV